MLMMPPGGHVGRSHGGLSTCPPGFFCRGREPMSVALVGKYARFEVGNYT